jgi:MFS family permease
MADKFGRRPLLAIGALVMCISMCVVGDYQVLRVLKQVVSRMEHWLLYLSGMRFKLLRGDLGMYLTTALSEIFDTTADNFAVSGSLVQKSITARLQEKTITIATFLGFCSSILITYFIPYLQNAGYANLQRNIGFVWSGLSVLPLGFVIFYIPKLRGRSLEERDDMFQQKIKIRRFGTYRNVQGIGNMITQAENEDAIVEKDGMVVEERLVDCSK